jgi:hypothetical protein
MRTTLQDTLANAELERRTVFKAAHFDWLLQYEGQVTHAVTLTLDPKKISAFTSQFSRSVSINDREMIERYQDSLRQFIDKLDKALFGNSSKRHGNRLLFVPVIEGLSNGEVPHFHCSVGIPADRAEVFEEQVKACWSRVPFSGFQIMVEPYRDAGWLSYSTKGSKFINRPSIDWLNVRIPSSPNSVTTNS